MAFYYLLIHHYDHHHHQALVFLYKTQILSKFNIDQNNIFLQNQVMFDPFKKLDNFFYNYLKTKSRSYTCLDVLLWH